MAYRISFTRAELLELTRALELIAQEDSHADVNMDAASVAAKESAQKKLRHALGRKGPMY